MLHCSPAYFEVVFVCFRSHELEKSGQCKEIMRNNNDEVFVYERARAKISPSFDLRSVALVGHRITLVMSWLPARSKILIAGLSRSTVTPADLLLKVRAKLAHVKMR